MVASAPRFSAAPLRFCERVLSLTVTMGSIRGTYGL